MHHFANFVKEAKIRSTLAVSSGLNALNNGLNSLPKPHGSMLACSLCVCILPMAYAQQVVIVPESETETESESKSESQDKLNRGPYIGIGFGRSQLDADTSATDELRIVESESTGFQLTLGIDLSDWLSMEIHGTELGEAELSNDATISYRDYGLSGLAYFGGARDRYKRRGWTGFGRAGVGYMSNDAEGALEVTQEEGEHWILGLGAEYTTRSGVGLRAEGIAFGEDISYLQLGLLYRLGRAPGWMPFVGNSSSGHPDRLDKMSGKSIRTPTRDDSDGDGVDNDADKCPDTPFDAAVGDNGCAVFNGVVDGLTFRSGSAELTPGALEVLDTVAESLLQLPETRARVTAHTDSLGDAEVNMQLSKLRAFEVAKYLVEKGVAKDRLEARAFGELRPIDTNTTAQGRSNNRRVEIFVISE